MANTITDNKISLGQILNDTKIAEAIYNDPGLLNIVTTSIARDGAAPSNPSIPRSTFCQQMTASLSPKTYDSIYDAISENIATFVTDLRWEGTTKQDALKTLVTAMQDIIQQNAGDVVLANAHQYFIYIDDADLASLTEQTITILGFVEHGLYSRTNSLPYERGRFISGGYRDAKITDKNAVFTGVDVQIMTISNTVITQSLKFKIVTWSMHSGLIPVSTLGRDRAKGFSRGDRTVAGTIIATVAVEDPLMNMQPILYSQTDMRGFNQMSDFWKSYLLPDQLPIFDMVLFFQNEHGNNASMAIFGVKIPDNGATISMQDSEIEVTYTYMAMDIEPIRMFGHGLDDIDINDYELRRNQAYSGRDLHGASGPYQTIQIFDEMNYIYSELGRN